MPAHDTGDDVGSCLIPLEIGRDVHVGEQEHPAFTSSQQRKTPMNEYPYYSPAPRSLNEVLALKYPITSYAWFVSGTPHDFYFVRAKPDQISIIYREATASEFSLLCSHVDPRTASKRWESFLERMNSRVKAEM